MNCQEFEKRLDALVDGAGGDELGAATAHLQGCRRCAALLETARGEHEPLSTAESERFVAGVLQRTVGSSCRRALRELCSWADGELVADESHLLDLHLARCSECSALATVLVALRRDLPALAEVDPGVEFAAEVVERTRAALARRPPLEERLRRLVERLVLRPRLAWELATVVCLVLTPLYGLPFSPLREMPGQALALMRIDATAVFQAFTQRTQPLWEAPVEKTWQRTAAGLAALGRGAGEDLDAKRRAVAATRAQARSHVAGFGAALANRDPRQASRSVRALGDDIGELWRGLRARAPAAGTTPSPD